MSETYRLPNPLCKVCFGKHVNVYALPASRLEACPACPPLNLWQETLVPKEIRVGENTKIDDEFLFGSKVFNDLTQVPGKTKHKETK
jgi:hypothetical protein